MTPFRLAWQGLIHAVRTERHMRVHLVATCLVIACALFFHTSRFETLSLIAWVTLVISLELVNTAIERTVDLVTDEQRPLAKQAKDVAASAVLVAAIGAGVSALLILGPDVLRLINVL